MKMTCSPGDYNCIVNNCSGAVGPGTNLFTYWATHDCPSAYSQLIFTAPDGTLGYSQPNQLVAQGKVVDLFNTYLKTNQITDDVTSTSYNLFQNNLISLCSNPIVPGICNQYLTGYCAGVTREQAINSPVRTDLCGCYVPPDPDILEVSDNPACDPLCHRVLTAQMADLTTGDILTCPQTVCAIDQITVTVQGSQIAGGINFTSICPGCNVSTGTTGNGCLCVVSGINLSTTFSELGIGVNVSQFCGPNSVCIVKDTAGNVVSKGGCTGISPEDIPVPAFSSTPNYGIIFLAIVGVVLVIIVIIAAYSGTPKAELQTISEEEYNAALQQLET